MNAELSVLPVILTWGLFWTFGPWTSSDRGGLRELSFYLYCVFQLIYLTWRAFVTFPPLVPGPLLAYATCVFAIEMLLTYASFRFMRGLLSSLDRNSEADGHAGWYLQEGGPPPVDILIATYNESWPILEKTLVGALRQDYPNVRVWICDDGRRTWLRESTEAIGAHYVTRSDNLHAKAGNLNAALRTILAGERVPTFIAVLDADFIPRRNFVSRAIALMHDERVGLVQTPQYHFNADPFQTAFNAEHSLPDTQRYIFNVILPARDAAGAAYCCGTSFLARTTALQAIGGLPTESITEDVLTSIKMGLAGYQTVYLRQVLTTGLAPEGVHEYLTQRGRWCLGSVQIGRWLIRKKRGGSLLRRLVTLEPFLRWGYSSLARALLMMIPIIYWATGVVPFVPHGWQIVWFGLPALVTQRLFMSWVSRGSHLPIVSQASALLGSFAVVPGLFKGLGPAKNHRFVVTDKGMNHGGVVIHWRVLRWLVGYFTLLLGLMIYRTFSPTSATGPFRYVSIMWSVINLMLVLVAAIPCIELPRRREEYRYATSEAATLSLDGRSFSVTLEDLSVAGARLVSPVPLGVGSRIRLELADAPAVDALVVRRHGRNRRSLRYGLRLETSDEARRALTFKIFCTDRYVFPADEGKGLAVTFAIVRRLFA